MNALIKLLAGSRLLKGNLDLHLVRGSMVLIFVLFGYQKWFEYEAQGLIPFISNGPLTFWMYPVFGLHGATYFLGVSEWLTAALLIWGFWNPKAGVIAAILCVATFVTTVTIIPFMPDGWDATAGFPAMKGNVAFLMKDVVLLGVSVYLLKQDVTRAAPPRGRAERAAGGRRTRLDRGSGGRHIGLRFAKTGRKKERRFGYGRTSHHRHRRESRPSPTSYRTAAAVVGAARDVAGVPPTASLLPVAADVTRETGRKAIIESPG